MAKKVKVGDRVVLLRDDRPGIMAPSPQNVGKVGIVELSIEDRGASYYLVDLGNGHDYADRLCLEVLP